MKDTKDVRHTHGRIQKIQKRVAETLASYTDTFYFS